MEITEWSNMIQEEREHKNVFFSGSDNSPIPLEQRRFFKELDYYPPDADYRFVIELHEHVEKKILKIEDTKGNEREFLRWGEFIFKIEKKNVRSRLIKAIRRKIACLFLFAIKPAVTKHTVQADK